MNNNDHKKKMIAPIVVTVIVILYYLLYFLLLIYEIPNLVAKIAFGIIPLILGVTMIYVCKERIEEMGLGNAYESKRIIRYRKESLQFVNSLFLMSKYYSELILI